MSPHEFGRVETGEMSRERSAEAMRVERLDMVSSGFE